MAKKKVTKSKAGTARKKTRKKSTGSRKRKASTTKTKRTTTRKKSTSKRKKTGTKGTIVAKGVVKRKAGKLYFVDASGNVRETAMKRRKKKR